MKIILLSSSKQIDGEEQIVTKMFEQGLQHFHLRKSLPRASIIAYLSSIPEIYHNRIILHSKHDLATTFNLKGIHLTRKHRKKKIRTWWNIKRIKKKNPNINITSSFHSLETLLESKEKFDYVFLSPVFDSISKREYPGKFKESNMSVVLGNIKTKVIALGGVDLSKVERIEEMGFDGMGLLGGIWKSNDPVAQFVKIKEECERRNLSLA